MGEVAIGARQRDKLGEGAEAREARLLLILADRRSAALALAAAAARQDERHGHAVTHRKAADALAKLRHDSR